MKKFNLIELLMVIGVISILLSFLIPSLARAGRESKRAVCQSNIKQLYNISMMFSLDNDKHFPNNSAAHHKPDRPDWYKQFTDSDRPYYLENKEILSCPVIHELYVVTSSSRTVGMNANLNYRNQKPDLHPKITRVSDPAYTIFYGDGFGHDTQQGTKMYAESITQGSRLSLEAGFIHDGTKNINYVDGHIESNRRPYLASDPDLWDYN
jgi:prepilin-type processing-associated H-X9-DG protein